ncbi:MAG: AsmA family protein, partial [Clostridiales bacterium]|nr:AsmA family protein [Clostridiales bacterium]
MKKILFGILYTTFTIIVVLAISLYVFSKIQHHSVHNKIILAINKEFDEKISFKNYSFSYLSRFPRVHLKLKDVAALDNSKEILKIGELDVLLNLMSLWNKKVDIERLVISDASLILEIDSLGKKPHLFGGNKTSTGSTHKSVIIDAHKIIIKNSNVYLGNMVKGNRNYLHVDAARLKLAAKDSFLVLTGELEGKLDSLISNNKVLFANQPVEIT